MKKKPCDEKTLEIYRRQAKDVMNAGMCPECKNCSECFVAFVDCNIGCEPDEVERIAKEFLLVYESEKDRKIRNIKKAKTIIEQGGCFEEEEGCEHCFIKEMLGEKFNCSDSDKSWLVKTAHEYLDKVYDEYFVETSFLTLSWACSKCECLNEVELRKEERKGEYWIVKCGECKSKFYYKI